MSHFSVAVFSDGRKSVEELLAPYQDNNMGDCPPEHLEFVSVTESMREEYETGECKMVCLQDGRYIYPWDGEGLKKEFAFKVYDDGRDHSDFAGKKDVQLLVIGDPCLGGALVTFFLEDGGAELRNVPYKKIYPTLQDFARDFNKVPWDEEKQDYGYWKNPNAKWDWWQKGGRWSKLLKTFSGDRCAEAKVADIDFGIDLYAYNASCRWWEVAVEGAPMREGEKADDFDSIYRKEDLLERYKNKESYAKIQSSVITDAVITPDGKWHQNDGARWPRDESAEGGYAWDMRFKEAFLDRAEPDWILTIVDCHY